MEKQENPGWEGNSYSGNSIEMDPQAREILIKKFQAEGLTPIQIRERLATINGLVMAQSVHSPHLVTAPIQRPTKPLGYEDLREIELMTQGLVTPSKMLMSLS